MLILKKFASNYFETKFGITNNSSRRSKIPTIYHMLALWMGYEPISSYGRIQKIPFPKTEGQHSCNYPLDQIVKDFLQIPDGNEYGFFIECDLKYAAEIKQITKNFPLCPYKVDSYCQLFSNYMNLI